jgi:hypothetical protein
MANRQKEVREIVKAAERQGWKVVEKRQGFMLYSPDGEGLVNVHKTPQDHRAIKNTVSRMRRYGFKWKGR